VAHIARAEFAVGWGRIAAVRVTLGHLGTNGIKQGVERITLAHGDVIHFIQCLGVGGEGKNGVLVPVRDAVALADAMIELAADGAKRETMGAASRAFAESLYDVRKVNAQMLSIMGLAA
jgi:hypothetical protein